MSWKPEHKAFVMEKHKQGASAAHIVRMLKKCGVHQTRNAVIGVINRSGGMNRGKEGRMTDAYLRSKVRRRSYLNPSVALPSPQSQVRLTVRPLKVEGDDFLPAGKQPVGCRYIAGDTANPDWSYCQRPLAPDSMWCPAHRAIIYTKGASEAVKEFVRTATGTPEQIAALVHEEFGVTLSKTQVAVIRRWARRTGMAA